MESIYFTLDKAKKARQPFNILIGGRGTGKSYSTLNDVYVNNGKENHFLYLRRTEVEISSIADEKYNPYKALNRDKGYDIQARYIDKNSVGEFYQKLETGEERFLGYAAALSTFGKLRGADLYDVDTIIFDEFIKTKAARPIKDEADLFFNAYETITRNRELDGHKPVTVYFLSNATTLNSPLLEELRLVSVIERMQLRGQTAFTDRERGLHVELLKDLKVSELKRDTALYKLTKGTAYSAHALDNEFAYDSFENIAKVQLNEYIPWIQLDDIYIYRHKHRLEYYVCKSHGKCQHVFKGDNTPLFKRNFGGRFYQLLIGGYVLFQSFAVKQKIMSYF